MLASAGGSASAQSGALGLGARAIGFLPFYEAGDDYNIPAQADVEFKGQFTAGFALQASYNFTDLFGVQVEGVLNTDAFDIEVSMLGLSGKTNIKAASIQLPILFKAGYLLDNDMYVGGIGGVYFTIPVTDLLFMAEGSAPSFGSITGTGTAEWKGGMGFTIGGVAGYVLGPGILFGDVRYSMDLSDVELVMGDTSVKFFKRSNIAIGIGYTLSLGGY
jgi:hypothetical protein